MKKNQAVIVIYEVGQIAEVQSLVAREQLAPDSYTIVALEFEVERALQRQNIPFESLLTFVPVNEEFAGVIMASHRAAEALSQSPAMRFFAYQGISLGEVFEPMLDAYLQYLGRSISLYMRVVELSGAKEIIVPHTSQPLSLGAGALVAYWFLAPVHAAKVVGEQKRIPFRFIGSEPRIHHKSHSLARRCVALGLAAYNSGIGFFIRKKSQKVFASEYWSHVASFVEKMDDMELVFMERSEIRKIPWRQLIKHRIRFMHPSDMIDSGSRKSISSAVESFGAQWHAVKGNVRELFDIVPGVDAWGAIEPALTHLVEVYARFALIDIEGLRRIMEKLRPDKVLLRASVGGSAHHFFIATQVARQLGIPSIELQHAGAVVDPRSVHARIEASYLAAYGPLTRDMAVKNLGYAPERIRAIGSPRFDHYVHRRGALAQNREETLRGLGLDPARPTVFAAVPFAGAFPLVHSSYQVADFFRAFREVQKGMPELQLIFKFRPGNFSEEYRRYAQELFSEGGIAMTNTSDFLPLMVASDAACTGKSTLAYEIMLARRPLVLFPWQRWDTYTLAMYKDTVPVAWSAKDLSEALGKLLTQEGAKQALERQNRYMSEQYSFDGHAPERMMALLREKLPPL